jgi:YHS domain-containing protein
MPELEMTRFLQTLVLTVLLTLAPQSPLGAAPPAPPVSTDAQGLAIGGYDPVAYFSQGRPMKGKAVHQTNWNGATWRFASAASLEAFKAAPDRYAPRYGGYRAWAVSQGYIAPGDPHRWKIVDGRLYLNFNARAKELWEADEAAAIVRGDANWPGVLKTNQNNQP